MSTEETFDVTPGQAKATADAFLAMHGPSIRRRGSTPTTPCST